MRSPGSRGKSLIYEYPKGSKITITCLENRTGGNGYNDSYRVYVPAKYTGKKHHLTQRKTEAEARALADEVIKKHQKHGQVAFNLTTEQIIDAGKALRHLSEFGIEKSLVEVVEYASALRSGRTILISAIA